VSGGKRFIIVSNRLPVTIELTDSGYRVQKSCGGLVSALRPVLRDSSSCWIGWTGTEYASAITELLRDDSIGTCSLLPVFLTEQEKACFYHGCSNEIIWPLFHDLQSRCNFDPAYWDVYRDVTEKFADAVEQTAHRNDFVWVHDYHLMMLADALRARELRLRLAYFHHIPFPPPDIFEKLPWRTEILRGLLQFDTVGFQTARDRRNFVACLRRCLSHVHISRRLGGKLLIRAAGSGTVVGSFPISIDFREFANEALGAAVAVQTSEIRCQANGKQIILGVDRLDYTKGIIERLLAFRRLIQRRPELHGLVTLVQVVVPSREDIPSYKELKLRIQQLISEINGEYGVPGWMPVLYLHRCLSQLELVAFYRAANVALITPLKDGMNLVAKEFCASRVDDDGVLVLSEFAGAATELKCGALLVNPYDTDGVATALYRALAMSTSEQRVRMQRMRELIRRNDIFRWFNSFCAEAAQFHFVPELPPGVVHTFVPRAAAQVGTAG
jgi:alpha,alpha-trehalose-phosphate synthase [UDP-forming]